MPLALSLALSLLLCSLCLSSIFPLFMSWFVLPYSCSQIKIIQLLASISLSLCLSNSVSILPQADSPLSSCIRSVRRINILPSYLKPPLIPGVDPVPLNSSQVFEDFYYSHQVTPPSLPPTFFDTCARILFFILFLL